MLAQHFSNLDLVLFIEIDGFSLTSYKFNICHPKVFNTHIKYTMKYQSNTTQIFYVFLLLY